MISRAFATSVHFIYSVLTLPLSLETTNHWWSIIVQFVIHHGPPERLLLAYLFQRVLIAELLMRKPLGLLVLHASIEY